VSGRAAPAVLAAVALSKAFRSRTGTVPAVQDVHLAVREGTALGVVGPSGAGKSTLLSLLLGLERPDRGEVLLDGEPVTGPRRTDLSRRAFQYVPQDPASSLDPRRTVGRQLLEPLRRLRVEGDHPAMAREALERVGLGPEHLARRPHELSGGQAQRVAIARALVTRPRILLADEAVSGLDLPLRHQVLELLKELRTESGLGLLLVSHDLAAIGFLCDRALVLDRGRVVEEGPADRILRAPSHPVTQELVDAVPRLPS